MNGGGRGMEKEERSGGRGGNGGIATGAPCGLSRERSWCVCVLSDTKGGSGYKTHSTST